MDALTGDEVCAETIVIRSNDDWRRVVRELRYDGQRYTTATTVQAGSVVPLRPVEQLEAWLGAR